MFIACQQAMDVGEEHNDPMDVRLRKFLFKTLKKPPVAGFQQFLKSLAMDCLVWASSLAKTPDDELPRLCQEPLPKMISSTKTRRN